MSSGFPPLLSCLMGAALMEAGRAGQGIIFSSYGKKYPPRLSRIRANQASRRLKIGGCRKYVRINKKDHTWVEFCKSHGVIILIEK